VADFVAWLRRGTAPDSKSKSSTQRVRSEATVNLILAAVSAFYEYQERLGVTGASPMSNASAGARRPYKAFLHHASKNRPGRSRSLKLTTPKRISRTLTAEQVQELIDACRRRRDRFLVYLLCQTGMRIGQALGLRHEDVRSYDNEIEITPRINANGARTKARDPYVVHVSKPLTELYADYLIHEHPATGSDYVFVNCWAGRPGRPMAYATVIDLFRRLSKKTGIKVRPHLLRHTHARDLIRSGMDTAYVQKRLGHAQIQTTITTYAHLADDDLQAAYNAYIEARKSGSR
jgi:integrase/recombinase XerD